MGENKNNSECWSWWKYGVIYHIYVRSFKDTNSDGVGDLRGIIEKLNYIKELGVSAIWLSPIYESPMEDYGYDIVNYRTIDSSYGTLDDFKELLRLAHQMDIKIIMDMVMNHTSHLHKWFLDSKSSKENPKRDWYIWKDAKNGKVPTNWKSAFGGSAWQYDKLTEQYYLHSFLKEQPDLNWRNQELKNVFFEEFKFWIHLGVDGFRLDVINFIIKDEKFRDNKRFTFSKNFKSKLYSRNRGTSIKISRELRQLVDSYDDKMLVGEIYAPPPGSNKTVVDYLADGDNALHLAFDFSIIFRFWSAKKYYKCILQWENNIPYKGWPCYVLSNHDLLRSYNRVGIGRNKSQKAIISAVLLLTLRGTPFIYYGEEIGMQNQKIKRRHIKDPLGKKYWPFFSGRDKSRTPMQWSDENFGGFSNVKPWLPINRNYNRVNVTNQQHNPNSLLNHYKKLIQLRNYYPALYQGDIIFVSKGEKNLLSYIRKYKEQKIFVVLNFGSSNVIEESPFSGACKLLYSSHNNKNNKLDKALYISPYEGLILLEIT